MSQNIFKQSYFDFLVRGLSDLEPGIIDKVRDKTTPFPDDAFFIEDNYPDASAIKLENKGAADYLLKNAIALHRGMNLKPFQASDLRLWSYLALVSFRDYMEIIRPIGNPHPDLGSVYSVDFTSYVLRHYLFQGSSVGDLLLNDISLLWWVAELTYSEERSDPYELTAEAFTMLDYTRHLLPGVQGRDKAFRHAVLEFVCENKDLFKNFKEGKVRLIQRKLNFEAGIRLFPAMNKSEIKSMIDKIRPELASYKE